MAPVPTKNIKSSPVKDSLHKVKPPKPSVPYVVFLHRQTLNQTEGGFMSKSCTKLKLTEKLIANAMKNGLKRNEDDLKTLSREITFKRNLRRHIARMKSFQIMQKKQKQQKKDQAKRGEFQPHPADSNIADTITVEDVQPIDEDVYAWE